ncbi:hypothetical protein ERC79_19895 [Rhodococcus sp. ABRD24]|nr:hypothetical protein ERC79_19895 [Rhodococcus sp. ABRD24]
MKSVARWLLAIAGLLGGVVAGHVLWQPMPPGHIGIGGGVQAMLTSNGAGVACVAVVAVLVTVGLTRRRSVASATGVAAAGALLLALPDVVRYPSEASVMLYSNAVAAGLLLGATSLLVSRTHTGQAALATGMLAAFLLSGNAVELRRFGANEGWTAYAPFRTWEPTAVVPLWVAVVTAAVILAAGVIERRASWSGRVDSQVLLGAIALPVTGFVANWILIESDARPVWWCGYVGLMVALVVWVAWRLPGSDGAVVFAGAAVLAAVVGGVPSWGTDWWFLAIPAVLLVGGIAVGLRWPRPPLGFALLAVTAAAALLNPDSWAEIALVASVFVLPTASGYVLASCLPTSAPASTIGFSLPFTIGIPGVAAAAWTVRPSHADFASALEWQVSVTVSAVVVAVGVIVVCGVGAWGLALRSGPGVR